METIGPVTELDLKRSEENHVCKCRRANECTNAATFADSLSRADTPRSQKTVHYDLDTERRVHPRICGETATVMQGFLASVVGASQHISGLAK